MGVIQDALEALIAGIPDVSRPAVQDDGFGSDLSCTDDLTEDMRELSGSDVRVVAEATYRRITTPRGALRDDPDYGLDVRQFLHKAMTASETRGIAGQLRLEVLKDDRVEDADVQVTNVTHRSFELDIRCQTALGPFELVGTVSDTGFVAKILVVGGE